eukprot:15458830-Alexandrium_andersonii.AAC.1
MWLTSLTAPSVRAEHALQQGKRSLQLLRIDIVRGGVSDPRAPTPMLTVASARPLGQAHGACPGPRRRLTKRNDRRMCGAP